MGNTTAYDYDAVGNLTSATDGNGHTSTSTYNQRHETLSRTNPLGEKESYEYNPVGTLSSATKADGTEISYSYDILNRLSEKLYKQADSNGETIQDAAPAEAEATTDSQTNSSEEPNSAKLINIFTRSSHPAKTSPTKTSPAKKSTDVKTAPTDSAPTDSAPADPTTAEPAQSQDSEDVSYNYDIMGSRTVMDGPEGETGYSYDKIPIDCAHLSPSVVLPDASQRHIRFCRITHTGPLLFSRPNCSCAHSVCMQAIHLHLKQLVCFITKVMGKGCFLDSPFSSVFHSECSVYNVSSLNFLDLSAVFTGEGFEHTVFHQPGDHF